MKKKQVPQCIATVEEVEPLDLVKGFKMHLCNSPDIPKGHLHMTMGETQFSLGKKLIGSLRGQLDGSFVVTHEATNTQWHVDSAGLFEAFREAIDARIKKHGTVIVPSKK